MFSSTTRHTITLVYGSILLIFVLIATTSNAVGVEYCNASNGTSEEYVRGRCVSFGQCPPLFRTLRSSDITIEQLRMLQKLTCLIDEDNPLICCSLTDISASSNYLTSYNKGIAPSKSNADIVYPTTPVYSLKPLLDLSGEDRELNRVSVKSKPKQFDLLPALEECGSSEVIEGSERIIGGSNATHGSYPWMARIGYRNTETGEIEYFCGASVINKNYVLTAAHCTKEIDLSRFQPTVVRLGEYNAASDLDCSEQLGCSRALDFRIEKIIPHPNYGIDEKSHDIELIRIKGNIPFDTPFVRPVCLPFEDEYDIGGLLKTNAKGLVSGWGRTQWNQAEGSEILQEILLPIISNEECRANYSSKIKISEMQMCAGGEKRKDSCGGDSGGPIIVVAPFSTKRLFPSRSSKPFPPVLHPKAFQLGVVSFGPIQCGVGGLPGVYTRVSAYKEWILSNLEP